MRTPVPILCTGVSRLFLGTPGNFLFHRAWKLLTQIRGDIFGGHRMEAEDPIPRNYA